MTAPKNDKARKAWLAGLKDGDEAAVIDDAGVCHEVGIVERYKWSWEITLGSFRFTPGIGRSSPGRRGAVGHCWLVPLTAEMRNAAEHRKAATKARSKLRAVDRLCGWEQFSDSQVIAVSAILWPEKESIRCAF